MNEPSAIPVVLAEWKRGCQAKRRGSDDEGSSVSSCGVCGVDYVVSRAFLGSDAAGDGRMARQMAAGT